MYVYMCMYICVCISAYIALSRNLIASSTIV